MRAITYDRYGPPEVLKLETVEKPAPLSDEILIRIHAAEATKSDCELRSFTFPVGWFWLPLRIVCGIFKPKRKILGGYFSGVIDDLGEQVNGFSIGDEVFGCANLRMGAYGEYASLPSNFTIVKKPRNLSFEEAAAIPLGGLNALHFLELANVKAGEKILINGAGGSIGSFAVQIAKSKGAHVTAIDAPHKQSFLQKIGADAFIDYTAPEFKFPQNEFDVTFNMVASASYTALIKSLKKTGRFVTANPTLGHMLRSMLTSKFTKKSAFFRLAKESPEELTTLAEMAEQGKIIVNIDRKCSMDEAPIAHTLVESEARCGAVVISMKSS